ncbi:MAG: caspase family protein [Treponema sp.]|nr:caspase family protein [Treponema sp.]
MIINKSKSLLVLGMLLFCFIPVTAENRVALVIGNGKYANTPLVNPPNDAADMAVKLESLGFTVIKGINADYQQMLDYIRDFQKAFSSPDTVALFYYSGHGVQVDGKNYLIPAGSNIQSLDEVESMAVKADFVYNKMQNSNVKTSIIILDACRNNPFAGSARSADRGLSIQGSFPAQSIVVYSTSPNQTAKDGDGKNGTFTASLLEHMDDPLDIELMLRSVRDEVSKETNGAQVPWANSSLTNGFSFIEGAEGTGFASVLLSVSGLPPQTVVSVKGKEYLTAKGNGAENVGKFAPGTYTVSLTGPYVQSVDVPVTIEQNKPLVLTPQVTELGKLSVRMEVSDAVNVVIHSDSGAQPDKAFYADSDWDESVVPGQYTLKIRKQDDIADGYTEKLTITAGQDNNLVVPEIQHSTAWQLDNAQQHKKIYEEKLTKSKKKRTAARISGWTFLGLGVASSCAAVFSYMQGKIAYDNYENAVYTTDSEVYRSESEKWALIATGTAVFAGVSFLVSPVSFLQMPNTRKIENSIHDFDIQIQKLSEQQSGGAE